MKVEVISTGTELLRGRTVDTNFAYLAHELEKLGLPVRYHTSYRDTFSDIVEGLRRALQRSDIILMTGGLGPTEDDLTRKIAAEVFQRKLIFDAALWKRLRQRFKRYGFKVMPSNIRQTCFPEGAKRLHNSVGSADGFCIEHEGRHFFAVPGVPSEMRAMFQEAVAPLLKKMVRRKPFIREYRFFGLTEAEVERVVKAVKKRHSFEYGITVGAGTVTLTLFLDGWSKKHAKRLDRSIIMPLQESYLGGAPLGDASATIEGETVKLLLRRRRTVAIAESCTGGLISHKLTEVPGISKSLLETVVCYSNRSKIERLGVSEELLRRYGAVSRPVAQAMAKGVARTAKAEIGLAVTGIAGPTGGRAEKPVGLAYIALSHRRKTLVKKFLFSGPRGRIKERAATGALNLLRLYLRKT